MENRIRMEDIICFDTETTGFGSYDEIIQLTITGICYGNAEVLYSNYFKPEQVSDAALANIYAGKERALESIMEIRNNLITASDGITYVQVQPTFLYESLWNLALLIILLVYWKYKKFDGEIGLLYLFGYGLGRLWIEGLRTDQLFLWRTGIAVSQLLSGALVVVSLGLIIYFRIRAKKLGTKPKYCDY